MRYMLSTNSCSLAMTPVSVSSLLTPNQSTTSLMYIGKMVVLIVMERNVLFYFIFFGEGDVWEG